MAFMVEMVVDRGVNGRKLLRGSRPPEPQHRPLASSERQVRVRRRMVEAETGFQSIGSTERLQGGPMGPLLVCREIPRPTNPPH